MRHRFLSAIRSLLAVTILGGGLFGCSTHSMTAAQPSQSSQKGVLANACINQRAIAKPVAAAAPSQGSFTPTLTSALALDELAGLVTLPLFKGVMADGRVIWFVVTEVSDERLAEQMGVNWAPKLMNALGTAAVQQVTVVGDEIQFRGTVDFSPARLVVPGPSGFPPAAANPGASGDAAYSPLITTGDGIVLNAPHVANTSGNHDRVVSIDFNGMQVTLAMTNGLYHGKGILYVSTEATDPGVAAVEVATFAPNLNAAPGIASNDPKTSARAGIVPIVNGPIGAGNPQRQGLQSALFGEGDPLNVTEIHPRTRAQVPLYSPLWDVHPAVWTDEAIAAGFRRLLNHHQAIAREVRGGRIVSGGFGPMNPTFGGLRAGGFIVNCPIMAVE